jgi:hypothetical protein
MIERIRRLPSPALIVASIALVLAATGGVTYAASKINGNKIKRHSIAGNRLKNNTVKGKQINESSLGVVPKATNAKRATTANTATKADNGALEFKFFATNGQTADLLTAPGVKFVAACGAGTTAGQISLDMVSTAANGIGKTMATNEGTALNPDTVTRQDDSFDTTENLNMLNTTPPATGTNREVIGQADFMSADGSSVVNVNYATEDGGNLGNGNADCAVWGAANAS